MHASRRSSRRTSAALLAAGAVAGALLATAPASADTVIVADPTVQNVTAYASTAAWSRRAPDGSHRLVVRDGSGVVADAAVEPSSVPFDPDLGPTKGNGRLVVYSRCQTMSTMRGCDVYGYDVGSRSERKIAAVSSARGSEVGPSYFKGVLAFGRIGSGGGLYVYTPGRSVRRIWSRESDQTDLSATRVVARGRGAGGTIRVSYRDGSRARNVAAGMRGRLTARSVGSPVLARYRAFWLVSSLRFPEYPASSIVETVSVRSASRRVGRVDRPFAGQVSGFALGSRSVPALTSGAAGIALIDPPLAIPL